MRIIVSLILFLGMILCTGCGASPIDAQVPLEIGADPAGAPLPTPLPDSPDQEIPTPDRINPTVTKIPERVPPENSTPIVGEVPNELLDAILSDLATRIGVALENITVIQGQATVWPDGSMGCAQPGLFYTQALVNGYWVILDVDGKQYDYRASDRGYFFLCEGKFHPSPPSGTPSS
jgi:hypothetical protein